MDTITKLSMQGNHIVKPAVLIGKCAVEIHYGVNENKISAYIVVRRPTNGTAFALNALPPILLHRDYHIGCKLKTSGMSCNR